MFGIFPYVFSNIFNTVINNSDIIDNIVDSVLNSDLMNEVINNLENMLTLNVEFKEYKNKYLIDANLPGVDKNNINIEYDNNYITVSIKRNNIYSNGKNVTIGVFQQENDVSKDFYVENINPYNIKAVFKDQRLRVYIPKKDKLKEISTVVEVYDYIDE